MPKTKRFILRNPTGSDAGGVVFYRARDLARRYKIHEITVWKWLAAGNLPQPTRLGPNTRAWRSDIVEAWEKERQQQA